MVAPIYDWSGFYIGANGGWGSAHNCWDVTPFGGVLFNDGCVNRSGGVLGGQVGYRWQAGQFVFGLEGQGDWASLRGSHVSLLDPTLTERTRVDGIGLFTGQVGYAWNAALLYVKGGAAVTSTLFQRMQSELSRARRNVQGIARTTPVLNVLDTRLQTFQILVDNCRDALYYQYLLDTAKDGSLRRPIEFQEDLTDIPQWLEIKDTARREMDNAVVLAELLESRKEPLLDLAPTAEEENIRVLGPDLAVQLRKRVKIMVAHWKDYERLFDQERAPLAKH